MNLRSFFSRAIVVTFAATALTFTGAGLARADGSHGAPYPLEPGAEDPEAQDKPAEPEKPQGTPLKLRTPEDKGASSSSAADIGLKLALVAAVLLVVALYLRKKQSVAVSLAKVGAPRILSRTTIGMRSELLIVDVDGQRLLLGITPTNVTTLSVLTEEPKEAPIEPEVERRNANYPPRIPRDGAVSESLSRLLASARAELDGENLDPPANPIAAARGEAKNDGPPAFGRGRGRPGREPQSLEGQVRGLGSKRG